MMTVIEVSAAASRYQGLASGDLTVARSRHAISDISMVLAQSVRHHLASVAEAQGQTLCVFILRGGALLLPGFLYHMSETPFCLLALRRDAVTGRAEPLYLSDLPDAPITTIVYVDCIAASGGTVEVARAMLRKRYRPAREVLAVIASSAFATDRLAGSGVDVIGISLSEKVDGALLSPDLGRLDAGEILSGTALVTEYKRSLGL